MRHSQSCSIWGSSSNAPDLPVDAPTNTAQHCFVHSRTLTLLRTGSCRHCGVQMLNTYFYSGACSRCCALVHVGVAVQRGMVMLLCSVSVKHGDVAVQWSGFVLLYTKHAGAEHAVQWRMFLCMYITKHVGVLLVQFPPTLDVKCCTAACTAT